MIEERVPIFVIGYPKSGNTWLARLIADALNSPMVGGNNPIDKAIKKENCIAEFVIYKSHYSERSKPDYITGSTKIVYIVRDFRDVLVSGFFHNHRDAREGKYTIENSLGLRLHSFHRYYFKRQIKRMTRKWQGNEITVLKNKLKRLICIIKHFILGEKRPILFAVGNWSVHVNYWINFPNVSVIKYEDLLADTYTTIRKAFRKMGINCSEQRLFEAIERQSFNNRKKEFEEKDDLVNVKFMRKGVAGDWKRFLSHREIDFIIKKHGKIMKEMGYLEY